MIFKLKESLVGKKKAEQEATTLIDPKTGTEVNSVNDIKRISIDYFKDLLTKRSPNKGFEEVMRSKN